MIPNLDVFRPRENIVDEGISRTLERPSRDVVKRTRQALVTRQIDPGDNLKRALRGNLSNDRRD